MPSTILLVDDVAMFLEIQRGFLKMSTLNILCARDGAEAMGMIKDKRPDLVITDLHMPNMNGADLCAAIKGDLDLSAIPVVMTTSAGKTEDHEICKNSGCDSLLTKPFERGAYLDTIRSFIPELDRREPRFPFTAKIRFQAFSVTMSGTIINLSNSGLYIATEYELDIGTEILLVFSLTEEGNALVQAKGVVRWKNAAEEKSSNCYPAGFGVEFTSFAGESLAHLKRYLINISG